MDAQPDLDPQTAVVLADLNGPGAVPVSDLSPPDARAAIERFVAKWDLDPRTDVGATEDFAIPGRARGVDLPEPRYRPAGASGAPTILAFVQTGGDEQGSSET